MNHTLYGHTDLIIQKARVSELAFTKGDGSHVLDIKLSGSLLKIVVFLIKSKQLYKKLTGSAFRMRMMCI